MSIQDIRERLSWVLDGNSDDLIESHRRVLLSEVGRNEEVATREAQMRGWDLNEIEDLTQGLLKSARSALRDADRELMAAHHTACVEETWQAKLQRSWTG